MKREEFDDMDPRHIDVSTMQCWLFRMAQRKWHLEAKSCMTVFVEGGVLDYIEDCYGSLHVSGFNSALNDVEDYLKTKGVAI